MNSRIQIKSIHPENTGMKTPKINPIIFFNVGFSITAVTRTIISVIVLTNGIKSKIIWGQMANQFYTIVAN